MNVGQCPQLIPWRSCPEPAFLCRKAGKGNVNSNQQQLREFDEENIGNRNFVTEPLTRDMQTTQCNELTIEVP
jgi:hypothetical protein